MSRPLTLHVSALNDAEYSRYTASIHDILDSEPPDYDKAVVGIREARAWLRGRYPTLASHTLDSVRPCPCPLRVYSCRSFESSRCACRSSGSSRPS